MLGELHNHQDVNFSPLRLSELSCGGCYVFKPKSYLTLECVHGYVL
jgi:hypothetical protein